MNTTWKVIGLTRLGIKPKSTAQEADALTARPTELLKCFVNAEKIYGIKNLRRVKCHGEKYCVRQKGFKIRFFGGLTCNQSAVVRLVDGS